MAANHLRRMSLPSLTRIFVYGTLRVGQYNYSWCEEAVEKAIKNCTASGRIYFVDPLGAGYPVAKLDEHGTIYGDILYFNTAHPLFDAVVRMELGAGYVARNIQVTTPKGRQVDCQAFHYLRIPRGSLIREGDWAAAISR